jgi:hypothetical protein
MRSPEVATCANTAGLSPNSDRRRSSSVAVTLASDFS